MTDRGSVSAVLSLVTISVLALPLSVSAAPKPWDVARFSACIAHGGDSPMDPDETLTTVRCGEVDKVEQSQGDLMDLYLDKSVAFVRNKTGDRRWTGGLRFKINYARSTTIAGGNAYGGFADFDRMTMLWPDGLQEISLPAASRKDNGCSHMNSGLLAMTRCDYEEMRFVILTPELAARFRALAANENARLRVKFFARDGATFETLISSAEIEAGIQAVLARA